MLEDMTIRRSGAYTQRNYVRQVREFTAFLGLSPDQAEQEDPRRYQLHLASPGASYFRMNLACTALRFSFHVTLGRTRFGDRMARIPTPERLPVVLSTREVALLLAHARSLKDRAALSIAPGGGLSADGSRWIPCRPGFFLPVCVLSRLFRRLFLDGLACPWRGGVIRASCLSLLRDRKS